MVKMDIVISILLYALIALLFYIISRKISPKSRKDELYACGEVHPEIKIGFFNFLKRLYRVLKRGLKLC